MKRILTVMALLPLFGWGQSSSLSLQQAYDLAEKNYPVIKQRELVKQTTSLTIENLSKGFLPQFALS